MDFSISDAIKQNTLGLSEGFPAGVPKSYSWYKGRDGRGLHAPPADFTAVEGWGAVYQQVGAPAYSNPDAAVQVANAKTYVHLKETGQWVLVQDQSKSPIGGGHFVPDFAGNAGYDMKVTALAGGGASFAAPPSGHNDHFWYQSRGTYAAGTVDAVYVQMDMRVTDPNLNLVAIVGADWWRDAHAPYANDHSNNPAAGSSNWVKLSTEWRTLGYYSMNTTELQKDLPPSLRGAQASPSPASPMPSDAPGSMKKSFDATSAPAAEWATFSDNDGFYQTAPIVAGQSHQLSPRPGLTGPTAPIEVLTNDSFISLALLFGVIVKIARRGSPGRRKRDSRNPERR